ncbi:MAG: PD-(D/E)XK nuclease family protein [Blastocatellales bacterium]|nr:PD-(D/E)XK nuclease family protein [Blastocatellales bacterium]
MANQSKNLLLSLHRWAVRQDENFTTEALVFVLNHLLLHEPKAARSLLERMTDGFLNVGELGIDRIRIATQTTIAEGRPDIEISAPGHRIYIEVKVDAALEATQLERYRQGLASSGVPNTQLILLSRYPMSATNSAQPDRTLRWYQVSAMLEDEMRSRVKNPKSGYLIQQFVEFLQARNMSSRRVASAVSQGLWDYLDREGGLLFMNKRIRRPGELLKDEALIPLYNLLIMMGEALKMEKIQPKLQFDSGRHNGGWIGYNLERMRFWLFVYVSDPDTVIFDTGGRSVVDPERFDGKSGELLQNERLVWRNRLNLVAPEIKFYSQSREQQNHILKDFVHSSYQIAQLLVA